MDDYEKLLEKLRRIEALHRGATTPGEREAAIEAHRRVAARLASTERPDPVVEYRFKLDNTWSRKLFLAVARRRGLKPYRYPRQRYNTVMVRLTEVHMNEVWSEFQELDQALRQHLDSVAERVISEAISNDTSEATEVAGELE